MLISKIFLKAKYTYSQYAGAGVVLMGIVVVLIPTFFAKKAVDLDDATVKEAENQGFWIGVQVRTIRTIQ